MEEAGREQSIIKPVCNIQQRPSLNRVDNVPQRGWGERMPHCRAQMAWIGHAAVSAEITGVCSHTILETWRAEIKETWRIA